MKNKLSSKRNMFVALGTAGVLAFGGAGLYAGVLAPQAQGKVGAGAVALTASCTAAVIIKPTESTWLNAAAADAAHAIGLSDAQSPPQVSRYGTPGYYYTGLEITWDLVAEADPCADQLVTANVFATAADSYLDNAGAGPVGVAAGDVVATNALSGSVYKKVLADAPSTKAGGGAELVSTATPVVHPPVGKTGIIITLNVPVTASVTNTDHNYGVVFQAHAEESAP
ncbi:MAG: hypothetical protein WCP28_14240 [Actinomycetes bacterium]